MNELQLLQQAYSNGTATPEQIQRLRTLLVGQGESPLGKIKSMFQQPTGAYYDNNQGKWIEKGSKSPFMLDADLLASEQKDAQQFFDNQPQNLFMSDANLLASEQRDAQSFIDGQQQNPFMSDADLLASEQKDAQQFFDVKTRNLMQDGTLTPLNSEDWKKGLLPTNAEGEGEGMPKADMFRFPMINPGGSDLSTEIYSLGRALGAEKGTPGRGMNIVGAGGAAALDIARNLASGIGFSKRNQYVTDWYKKKQQERNYVPDSQSEDQNSTGGFKLGGTMNMFAEDGMTMTQEQMQPQQPQEQMPEGQGQDQQMQQVVQMIAGMLQQGANPQQVLEALVQQGIPQQQAEQMIQMVVQQMQQSQGQQAPAAEQPQDQQMVMKNGGTFDKRVGESVTIKVGGKKVKGVIKEIKNGQITLK